MRIRDRAAFNTQDMSGQGPANAPFVSGCRGCRHIRRTESSGQPWPAPAVKSGIRRRAGTPADCLRNDMERSLHQP